MSAFTEIKKYIQTFEKYGCKEYENGTKEYGHAPFIAPEAYNFCVFATLNEDDIVELERDLKREIPAQFRSFLMTDSNGLHLFFHFSLYGMRKSYNRNPNATPEPYGLIEPNIYERPKNAKDTYFFIGGYRYDGSKLYIDSENGKVHFCKSRDATSLLSWDSFEDMLISESQRLFTLYDDRGRMLVSREKTLPIQNKRLTNSKPTKSGTLPNISFQSMENPTHSWNAPYDEMSFEDLVKNCDKYDDPFDYAIFCDKENFLTGRFYVYLVSWDVYPADDEATELLKELDEYGCDELIQLVEMDDFQNIIHEQRYKKADSTIEDYWTALQIRMDEIKAYNKQQTD